MPTFKAFKKNSGKKSRRKKIKTCLFFDKYIGKLNYEKSDNQKGGKQSSKFEVFYWLCFFSCNIM